MTARTSEDGESAAADSDTGRREERRHLGQRPQQLSKHLCFPPATSPDSATGARSDCRGLMKPDPAGWPSWCGGCWKQSAEETSDVLRSGSR